MANTRQTLQSFPCGCMAVTHKTTEWNKFLMRKEEVFTRKIVRSINCATK